jgi:hypothetical protein
MILLNGGEVQLHLMDFCINGDEFLIVFSVVKEVCYDSPILESLHAFDYVEELWVM